MSRARGFTLIEVLVAIALMASAVTLAYRGLAAVSRGSEQLNERIDTASEMDRLFARIERELLHRVRHEALAGGQQDGQMFFSFSALLTDDAGHTRRQRIEYRQQGASLLRLTRDEETDGGPQGAPLFDQIDTLAVRFMAEEGRWQTDWQSGTPRALEFTLKVRGEQGVRVFALR